MFTRRSAIFYPAIQPRSTKTPQYRFQSSCFFLRFFRRLLVDKGFVLKHRGQIAIKGKGRMDTWFLTGVLKKTILVEEEPSNDDLPAVVEVAEKPEHPSPDSDDEQPTPDGNNVKQDAGEQSSVNGEVTNTQEDGTIKCEESNGQTVQVSTKMRNIKDSITCTVL